MLCTVGTTVLAGSDVTVTDSVIAAGGGFSESPGACFTLDGTIGQSVAGLASGADLQVQGGYWAVVASSRRDTLFSHSFEECL